MTPIKIDEPDEPMAPCEEEKASCEKDAAPKEVSKKNSAASIAKFFKPMQLQEKHEVLLKELEKVQKEI